MSFINKAKNEICETKIIEKCDCIAELSAIIQCDAKIVTKDDEFSVAIDTDVANLPNHIKEMLELLYQYYPNVEEYEDFTFQPIKKYRISIEGDTARQLLTDCRIIRDRGFGNYEINHGISGMIVSKECCMRSYVKGVFIATSSANIKIDVSENAKKHRGGYHLEFVFSNERLAKDFVILMSGLSYNLKVIGRKNNYVCYIKEMETISDILALVGANKAVMELQNELAFRDVRNNLNRQLNCMNANIGKTVDASFKQFQAIKLIDEKVGIENLPENLIELCLLRLANPEENFEQLRKLSNPPLTKSCINHRFRKIMEIAKELESNQQIES